jgi:T5SS/PEP-CTERM-associated repeat protein
LKSQSIFSGRRAARKVSTFAQVDVLPRTEAFLIDRSMSSLRMNRRHQSARSAAKKAGAIYLSGSLLLVLAPAGFSQTLWQAQSGNWFQPTNWSDGIPTSSTDGQINNGGTAQVQTGTAAAGNLYLAFDAPDTGNLLVAGAGTLQVTNELAIGYAGTGSLTIQDGGVVSGEGGSIGVFPDSLGTVTVDGVGSTWTVAGLAIGGFGNAALTVLNGGSVITDACSLAGNTHFGGGFGSALVDGAGSSLSCNQSLDINGSLTAQNGGAVVSNNGTVNGAVTLDGAASSWTTGMVIVAPSTFGSVAVRNGAILTSDDLAYIGTGPFLASVTVDGPGSRWENDFDQVQIYVGYGDYGALNLTAGGVVSAFAVGVGPQGTGEVTVDGADSALNVRTNLYIGGADFGDGPQPGDIGLLEITGGGAVSSLATTIFGQGTVIDDGSLTTEEVEILPGGSLRGNGIVSGNVNNAGQVAPGDPLGTLAIVGNFAQASTDKSTIEIAGPDPDAQAHLSITGSATVDGTLEVRFAENFLPAKGQTFDLIDVAGAVDGSFSEIVFPDLRSGFLFSGEFLNGVYRLTALSDGAPAAGLLNISTRGQVGVDDDALIAGFIVTGTTAKQILVRGLGPSLVNGGIAAGDVLADPMLELRDETGTLITFNDNWIDSPDRQAIINSMLAPGDGDEAAIVATLDPGSYTAILRGTGSGTGLGIVEAYNLDPGPSSSLVNISTRGLVNTGNQVLIGGFIIDDQNASILLRGLGPSLEFAGVSNALANPALELHNSDGDTIAFNDDWLQSDEAIIRNAGLVPSFSEEAVIITTLGPGAFTAILRGRDAGTGVGLFEAYNLR